MPQGNQLAEEDHGVGSVILGKGFGFVEDTRDEQDADDAPKDHVGPQPRKQERSHQRNERRDGNP